MSWLGWASWALGWAVALGLGATLYVRERAHRSKAPGAAERLRAIVALRAEYARELLDLRRGLFAVVLAAGGEVKITRRQMVQVDDMALVSTDEGFHGDRVLRIVPKGARSASAEAQ